MIEQAHENHPGQTPHRNPWRIIMKTIIQILMTGWFVLLGASTAQSASAIINNFDGLFAFMTNLYDQAFVPDVHGAAGPQGILATVNSGIAYYQKSGQLIWGPTN